jgi:hypothetical protein
MKLRLEMELDNAAFDDADAIVNALAAVGRRIEDSEAVEHPRRAIIDTNGNIVGHWTVTR